MKPLHALTAFALLASVSITGIALADVNSPSPAPVGSEQRALSVTTATAATQASTTVEPVAPVSLPSTTTAPVDTGRVIVLLKESATPSVLSAVAKSADSSAGAAKQIVQGRFEWRVPKGRSAKQFAAQLQKSGRVKYAVPDFVRQPVGYLQPAYLPPSYVAPNDPDFNSPLAGFSFKSGTNVIVAKYPSYASSWWLREIHAPAAWAQGYTGSAIAGKYPLRASGSQVTVVVLDSGLYTAHPEIGAQVVGGHDFFNNEPFRGTALVEDGDVTPVSASAMPRTDSMLDRKLTAAHGTCVSGEIGAALNNSQGTVGVGYDTNVIVHKVMGRYADRTVGIDDVAVIRAIHYSIDINHAKVINMSFGGYDYSAAIADAINYAYSHGCVIVAAKGNDASRRAFYPASNSHVISVGALDKNSRAVTIPASYTNYARTSLDIMAPGSFVWGLYWNPANPNENLIPNLTRPGYYVWDGTSMASPVVAGAVAWLWRAAPALSNAEITSEILNSSPRGPRSSHFPSGYRKLDMAAAYARLKTDYPLLVPPAIVDQTVASLGNVPVTWGVPLAHVRDVTYDVTVDGTPMAGGPTSDTGRGFNWPLGLHTVAVQADSSYNWDDGSATNQAEINVVASVPGTSTWAGAHVAGSGAVVATPSYGGAVAIDATLEDASGTALSGAVVTLQSSTDGQTFSDVPGAIATNLPSGLYRSVVSPRSRTWYRFAFSTYGAIIGASSASVAVVPGVSLATPWAKSSVSHTVRFTVSGKLMPAHTSSSRQVKLKITRWNGHRWADYASVWTRVTRRTGGYSTYSASIRLKKGGYRLYAFAPFDGLHSATTSGYRPITVK